MGCCLAKENNIIIIKAKKDIYRNQANTSKIYNKNKLSSNSLDFQLNELKKNQLSSNTLFSNEMANDLDIIDFNSDVNNHNNKTFKEILEYF